MAFAIRNSALMARIVLQDVCKAFESQRGEPVRAVNGLNLDVQDNELLVLVGPSGCGKTTTLRLIAGLEEPSSGTISIDGQIVNHLPPQARNIAMVFQHDTLYPHMTVQENLALGLKLRKLPRAEIQQRVREAAELLGLAPVLTRLPRALSGGERQRVALGRAMVRRPRMFLLDEPLANLDAPLRAQLRREILALHQRLRAATLYVTHDQAEAMPLGQRIAVMKDGALEQIGEPLAVYEQPATLFVASFIGSPPMNLLPGSLVPAGPSLAFKIEGPAGNLLWRLPEAIAHRLRPWNGKPIVLGLRPEDIHASAEALSEPTAVLGAVEGWELTGADVCLLARVGQSTVAVRSGTRRRFSTGQPVGLRLNVDKARWFDPETQRCIA